jgi:dihydroorotase
VEGLRRFPRSHHQRLKRARTRVLAFLNIVSVGMHTGKENDPAEMDAEGAARLAKKKTRN